MQDDDGGPGRSSCDLLPVTIRVNGQTYTAGPSGGEVVIGRTLPAHIRVEDSRISRAHVRIEPHEDKWYVVDAGSRNGTFLGGRRIDAIPLDGIISVQLGHPDGITATVSIAEAADHGNDELDDADTGVTTSEEALIEDTTAVESVDPGIGRAGAAVAARREKLGLSQRKLTEDRVVSQSVLVNFERGRHWPRENTRAKIEEYLRWRPGTIARLREGAEIPDDQYTDVISPTVQAELLIDATEIAVRSLRARIALLPAPGEPAFTGQAAALLSELRRLEVSLATAARNTTRGPGIALLLRDVRQAYADLALEAARTPAATAGQKLFAVRHRSGLHPEEVAQAAGVTEGDVVNVEAERPVPGPVAAAIAAVVDLLTERPTHHGSS